LIKDVSHELRSPLARLQFALALAQQRSNGLVDAELARAKQAADYLNDIITEILSLPVHDQLSMQLDDTIDLHELLSMIIENHSDSIIEKSINMEFKANCNEALVATHGNMLMGVFENILRNAIHYTPFVGNIHVRLHYLHYRNIFTVIISDSGTGVPAENLDDIFQPFFRTDSARGRESGGHGLGLAIANRSVALHHGKIWAENIPGSGLQITVEIPAKIAPES
jgi:two-component system, OmpR family, sensor histidine kinase CpxA